MSPPPALNAHSHSPVADTFATKISSLFADPVIVCDPKTARPGNVPVATEDPSGNTDTPVELSIPVQPALTAHTQEPLGDNLATNTSDEPSLTKVVPPKFAVPRNVPVTIDEPSDNALTSAAQSQPAPPARATQAQAPLAETFPTYAS